MSSRSITTPERIQRLNLYLHDYSGPLAKLLPLRQPWTLRIIFLRDVLDGKAAAGEGMLLISIDTTYLLCVLIGNGYSFYINRPAGARSR
jgi:hypothetical protein